MQELENRLQNFEEKMDKILILLDSDHQKLNNHIDFIEDVYKKLRYPLTILCEVVSSWSNTKFFESCNLLQLR